jgi:hypothetical protein
MASKREGKSGGAIEILGALAGKAFEVFGMGAEVFSKVGRGAERRAAAFAAKLGLRLLLHAWVSAGIFLGLIGLFYLLIDSAGIPRGVVFSVGGALVALLSLLLLHFAGKGLLGDDGSK